MYQRISPVDRSVTWKGLWPDPPALDRAVEESKRAQPGWQTAPIEKRIEIAKRYAEFLSQHREPLSHTISLESGKPLWESLTEVQAAIGKVDNAIDALRKRRWTTSEGNSSSASSIRYHPLGVTLVLGPYNLPLHLPGAHIVPALLAGNTVLLKPSEKTPAVGDWIQRGWMESGLPLGVLQTVHGAAEVAQYLVGQHDMAGVFFTGSYRAGLAIHKALAGRPECVLALEMGGNNPLLIVDTHDENRAIETVIQSAYITSGQRCTCARRIITIDSPSNRAWVQRLAHSISRIVIGDPLRTPQPFMGALVSEEAAASIMTAQSRWAQQGATPWVRSKLLEENRAVVTPGLWEMTPEQMEDEEHFGPLASICFVSDLDQAIEVANSTKYGLAAGLISRDAKVFEQVVDRVRAGIINWNSPTTGASGKLPFGGVGASGNHRPSGYFASDYCSYPVASVESRELLPVTKTLPGLEHLFDPGAS